MRASVVTSFEKPLEMKDVPMPEPGPGQVLVRVEASGLCHTDIHAARGDWPVKPSVPFTPGHEGVGIVERVAALATIVTGDIQGKIMTDVQPMKMAAAEGLYETEQSAGFSVFTIGSLDGSREVYALKIPGLL